MNSSLYSVQRKTPFSVLFTDGYKIIRRNSGNMLNETEKITCLYPLLRLATALFATTLKKLNLSINTFVLFFRQRVRQITTNCYDAVQALWKIF